MRLLKVKSPKIDYILNSNQKDSGFKTFDFIKIAGLIKSETSPEFRSDG